MREHFSTEDTGPGLILERPILVASWQTKFMPATLGGRLIEKLYLEPDRGWVLKKEQGEDLIPLNKEEVDELINNLRSDGMVLQSPIVPSESYLSEHAQEGVERRYP